MWNRLAVWAATAQVQRRRHPHLYLRESAVYHSAFAPQAGRRVAVKILRRHAGDLQPLSRARLIRQPAASRVERRSGLDSRTPIPAPNRHGGRIVCSPCPSPATTRHHGRMRDDVARALLLVSQPDELRLADAGWAADRHLDASERALLRATMALHAGELRSGPAFPDVTPDPWTGETAPSLIRLLRCGRVVAAEVRGCPVTPAAVQGHARRARRDAITPR